MAFVVVPWMPRSVRSSIVASRIAAFVVGSRGRPRPLGRLLRAGSSRRSGCESSSVVTPGDPHGMYPDVPGVASSLLLTAPPSGTHRTSLFRDDGPVERGFGCDTVGFGKGTVDPIDSMAQ